MNAIIYTTNTGSTEHYAKLLAQKTGLPVYSLAEAKKRVFAGAEVIYLGWIMAGSVKGYAEAAKRYQVRAVCGVGMGQTGTQTDSVRKKSAISADIPLFTLQGNFDVKKLWGDRIFEKCGIRRDEEGDGGKTLEIRGKRRLSARDGGANYQQS